jgi:hypothetical protein
MGKQSMRVATMPHFRSRQRRVAVFGEVVRAETVTHPKGATVICPALDEYETLNAQKLVPMPLRANFSERPQESRKAG